MYAGKYDDYKDPLDGGYFEGHIGIARRTEREERAYLEKKGLLDNYIEISQRGGSHEKSNAQFAR